jgi:molybdenum cofactor biosynthesis enzyme MoaA
MNLKSKFRDLVVPTAAGARIEFLVNDMVIEEQLCHLKCSYCLTEEYNLLMAVPDARARLTTDHRQDWHELLDVFHTTVDAPVLRISGGEFFWLRASTEFIEECSRRYETVQIITNGVFLNPDRVDRLAALGNCLLNISLDGHTMEMNRHRFPERQGRLLDLILGNLDNVARSGIRTDVQMVLTDANAGLVTSFCEYLVSRYDQQVRLFFFPVRGSQQDSFVPPPADYLAEVVERYDEFAGILPPRAYVEHIATQIRTGRRTLQCFIPATMSQLFGSGDVSACPHAWLEPLGNLHQKPELLTETVAAHRHYDLFLQERPRFSFCKGCATPSDVVNLYLLDVITEDEIGGCFLYSGSRTLARLRDLKQRFASLRGQGQT